MITQTREEIYLDTLKEVGNIGAGNAMTALSNLIDSPVDMSVPHIGIATLSEFSAMTGGPEAAAAGVYMFVDGDAPGHVAFLLPHFGACLLVDHLLMQPPGTTSELGEMECSALREVCNIMVSSYLVAISDLTGLNLLSSPPVLAVDMAASILSTVDAATMYDDTGALTIITQIFGGANPVEGYFIYIPETGSFSKILRALQVEI